MKLSLRELILAWVTGVVVLFLPTYLLFVTPRVADYREKRSREATLRADLASERQMLAQGAVWQGKLAESVKILPSYPETMDVTADILGKIDSLATGNSLVLTRREQQKDPKPKDAKSVLGTLDIKCNWEGTLDALTHFLFALQQDHGMLDISQLYIKSENKGLLKGTFIISCSYMRQKAPAPGVTNGSEGSTTTTNAAAAAEAPNP